MSGLADYSDGSVVISVNMDVSDAEKELGKLKQKIEKTEQNLSDIRQKRDAARQKSALDAAALDTEKAKLQEIKDRLADIRAMAKDAGISVNTRENVKALIPSVQQELADQRERVRGLQADWNKTAAEAERYDQKLRDAEAALEQHTDQAAALQQQIRTAEQARSETARNAEVSDQRIVDLNRELLELKARQKELEQANVGLGYQEYDQNAARIAEITRQLKEYQKSLAGTDGGGAEGQIDRSAQAAEKLNSIIGKLSPELGKKASEIAGQVLPVLESIAPKLTGQIVPAITAVGGAIGGIVAKLAPVLAILKLIWDVAKKVLRAAMEELRRFLGAVQKGASALWNAGGTLADWLSGGMESAKKFGSAAVSAFTAAAKSLAKLMADMNVLTKLSDAVGKKLKRLGQMIRRVFVFSVITKGLRAIRSQITAYLGLNEQLTVALRRLQGVLLTAFQPIYDVVVPALTTLVNVLSRVIAAISQFFAALFGTTAKKAQANAKALYGQTKALKATGAAAKEAGEEAEEAIGSLAGFDEINTIETEKKSGGGGSGGGGGGEIDTGPLFDWEYDETPFDSWGEAFSAFLDKLLAGLPKLEEAFKKFADWLNDLAKKLYDMFTFPGVLDKVKALGKGLAEALNKLVNWIDWYQLGKALGAGLNLALNFLTEFLYAFDWMNLGRKLADFINGLVSEIDWYEFGRLLWAGFKIALETLAGFLLGLDMPLMAKAASDTIRGFFDEMYNTIERIPWGDIGKQLATFLNNIDWYGSITVALKAISAAFEALFELLDGFVRSLHWGDIAKQIYTAINDSLGLIDWRNIGQTLGNAFVQVFQFVTDIVRGIDWHQIGQNIADFILGFDFVSALSSLGQLIAAGINAAIELVNGLLSRSFMSELRHIGEGIATAIKDAVEAVDWSLLGAAIGKGIKAALIFVSGLLNPELFYAIGKAIGDFLVGLDWVGIIGGLTEVLAKAINAAVAAVKGFLDSVQPNLKAIADGIAQKINEFVATVDWAELGQTISRGIEAALDFLIELMDQIDWDAIGQAIADFFTSIDWDTLLTKWGKLLGEVISAKMKALDISAVRDVGKNIIDGLWHGMWEKFNASGGILGMIKRYIVDDMIEKIMGWFGIHSPSKVFAEIGENLIAGLLQGITDTWNGVLEFLKTGVDAIKNFFSGAWDTVKQKTSESWNSIVETVSGIWDSIKETAGTIFDGIKEKIGGVWDGLKEKTSTIWNGIKTTLHTLWDGLKEKVSTIWGGIKEKISTVWDNIREKTSTIWDNVKTTLSTTWENLKTWAKEKFDNIKTAITTAWDNVKAKTTEVWNNIKTTLSGLWNELKTTVSTVFTEIKNKISEIWDKVKTAASQKWEEIKTTVKGKWEAIRDEAKAKFEEVRSKISEAWDNIKRDIPGKLDGIKSAIQEKWNGIVSSAKSWGSDLCSNLASGIEGAIGKVKSAARGVADRVSEYLHFSEPDVGPLSNFHTFMPDMLQLMAKGIRDNTHLAVSAASDLADSIANTVSGKSIGVDMAMPDISKFSIPLVAQGAKLPASREFTMVVQGGANSSDSLDRMEKLMQNMLERMGSREIVIHNELDVDGRKMARNTVRHINDMTRSAGRPVIDF